MASGDAKPFPIKNQAYRITFPIFDNDGDLVPGALSLDSEISKNGGTFVDCTNEAVQIATSSGMYYLDLTATEMNADTVAIKVKTTTTDATTTPIVLYPVENGDIPVNVKQWLGAVPSALSAGRVLANAQNDPTAAAIADAVWDEARSGHTSAGSFGQGVASVQGSVTGSVASVTGAVGSVSGAVGSVSGSIGSLGTTAKADVNAEVDTALSDINLHKLLKNAATLSTDVVASSVIDQILDDGTAVYSRATDSLQAIRDTPAEVNTEVDNALNTAIPASPTADSINERIKTLDNSYTAARAALLDNLDATMSSRSTLDSAGAQAASAAALVAIHLDHLLAADTPTLPGVAGSILHDLLEDDGGAWRFIANALEQAPGGSDPDVLRSGTVAASPAPTTTTLSSTALTEANTDYWVNKVVQITSGVAKDLTARITAFDAGTDTITFDPPLVVAPASGDTFAILRQHIEAAGLLSAEKATLLSAARKLVNKRDQNVASGVARFYDDAGTSVLLTDTPTETGGVITVTPG